MQRSLQTKPRKRLIIRQPLQLLSVTLHHTTTLIHLLPTLPPLHLLPPHTFPPPHVLPPPHMLALPHVLDTYNIPSCHWVQVDASWPHSVSTDCYLLFCCHNVRCLDFDKELATIMGKNTHLRTNMPGDQSSV